MIDKINAVRKDLDLALKEIGRIIKNKEIT